MSKHLKRKIAALLVVVAASMVVMGLLLSNMQEQLSMASYNDEMASESEQLDKLLTDAADEKQQNKDTFDDIYRSKAEFLVQVAEAHDVGTNAHRERTLADLRGACSGLAAPGCGRPRARAARKAASQGQGRQRQRERPELPSADIHSFSRLAYELFPPSACALDTYVGNYPSASACAAKVPAG